MQITQSSQKLKKYQYECTHTHANLYTFSMSLCVWKPLQGSFLELLISGKGFLLALQKAHSHDWVFFLGSIILDYAVSTTTTDLDLCHPSTDASSILLWRQGPTVKRRAQCTVTIKHYTEKVEATVVKQVLISHPFPILLLCLELLSLHMLWIYPHLTYTTLQKLKN